jgi:hypothetical protein
MKRAALGHRAYAVSAVLILLALSAAGAVSRPADAGPSLTEASAALPAAVWGVAIDSSYAGRFTPGDAAALRAAGVNALLVDVRRLGAQRATRLIGLAWSAKLTYLPIVATAETSTPAQTLRAACASYRSRTGVPRCAVAAVNTRVATTVAKHGGVDAVVVPLPGPGALPALRSGTSGTHVIGVVTARTAKLTPVWQSAIRHARTTRLVDLAVAPVGRSRADALRSYLRLLRAKDAAVTTKPKPKPPAQPGPASSGPADLFVSSSGSDGNRCTPSAPCASFNRAYQVASPGDVVEISGGSYRGQGVNGAPKSNGPSILFRPASGASVTVHDLDIDRGSHIEFRDLTVTEDTYNLGAAEYVTYRRVKMRQFFVRGADHISYIDSDVGPNVSNDGMNWITAAYQTNNGASDILLDGVRIHDFKKWSSGAHVDCIGIDDVDGLTIRNTKIWNCEHFSLIFGKDLWSDRAARNVLIENSFFDCCRSGYYAIGLGDIEGPMMIRFNSLTLGVGWLGGSTRNVNLNSNVIATNNQANCSKATWRYNVVRSGSACGGVLAGTGFRSPPNDLHLVNGAAAIGAGDPANHPATDIDGQPRPAGSRPDAGADES